MTEIMNRRRMEEWSCIDELLARSRHNLPLVGRPEDREEWDFLRPPIVSPMAAGFSGLSATGLEEAPEQRLWVPDAARGFAEAAIVRTEKDHYVINSRTGEMKIAKSAAEWVNPGELELCEDMANLVALSQGSVLYNLRQRYRSNLIHTYSGMFCITVNPWKWLPVYTPAVVQMYKGQELGRMPPHVFAVADNTYNNILQGIENQSILITGESGAGKTENTKKIIFYFAQVAGRPTAPGGTSLEEQIMESNPVLESFGNAKTLLNDNSSRFGKFTKILFDSMGKVCGAEMESYLLEKSRVHHQGQSERSYHIFYQLCSQGLPEVKTALGLTKAEANDYRFLANGLNEVDTIDDAEAMQATDHGLGVLGFSPEEKLQIYQITAGVMLLGEIQFAGDADQAIALGVEEAKAAAAQLGVNAHKLLDAFTSPMIRAGESVVQQSRGLEQAHNSVAAVAKAVYERLFLWIVARCNGSLKRKNASGTRLAEQQAEPRFVGVLDIAGFEIFPLNSFEQLCINYTNEKLQQFFNNCMFKKEMEEYASEGIKWKPTLDYAAQLQPTIDLIEKPNTGLFAMLEEECFVPKGSEVALLEKMHTAYSASKGKPGNPVYSQPTHKKDETDSDFVVKHYAGKVPYSVFGWLEKNKDPLSDCVIKLLAESTQPLIKAIWGPIAAASAAPHVDHHRASISLAPHSPSAHKSQSHSPSPGAALHKKGGSFATVAMKHKEQLAHLMAALSQTRAYFVRCLVPNRERRPGNLDAQLILHQLRCNGVLEGIRIAQEGFPNRLFYDDVHKRFRIFDTVQRDWVKAPAVAADGLFSSKRLGLVKGTDFQLGTTKVFFRVGILASLERQRMDAIRAAVVGLQAAARAAAQRNSIYRLQQRQKAVVVIQKAARRFARLQLWPWWKAFQMTKPMGSAELERLREDVEELEGERVAYARLLAEREKEKKRLEEELRRLQNDVDKVLQDNQHTQDELARAKNEKDQQELLIHKMHENIDQQAKGLNSLKSELDEEKNRIRALLLTNQQMAGNLKLLAESLNREKAGREELVRLGLASTTKLKSMEALIADLQARNDALKTDLSKKSLEAGRLSSAVADREDIIKRLREIIRQQQRRIWSLEAELELEREERRRLELLSAALKDKLGTANEQRDRAQVELTAQMAAVVTKNAEIGRLNGSLSEERKAHVGEVKNLRAQHADSITAFQDQIQKQSMSLIRLESERAMLQTVMEERRGREEEEWDARVGDLHRQHRVRHGHAIARHESHSPASHSPAPHSVERRPPHAASDPLAHLVENLEKEILAALTEKTRLSREMETLRRSLAEEASERASLSRLLVSHQAEAGAARGALAAAEAVRAAVQLELGKAKAALEAMGIEAATARDGRRGAAMVRELGESLALAQTRLSDSEAENGRLREQLRMAGKKVVAKGAIATATNGK